MTTRAGSPEPLRQLRTLIERERELASSKRDLIAKARVRGHSWSEIGAALGVTKQAAWQSYNDEITALLDDVAARANLTEDEAMQLAVDEVQVVRAARRTQPNR